MSSNKSARKELERRYGEECFIEKLHLRKDTEPRKYTSKGQYRRMKQLTYHHILERCKGGKATIQNGALLSAENHQWFHKQSKFNQNYMNTLFQEYKKQVDECKLVIVDDLEVPFEVQAIEFSVNEKVKYNRAKKLQEDRKMIKEWEEEK